MNRIIKRLFYGKFSKYLVSIILGLGLASLFKRACEGKNCMIFKAPEFDKIKGKVFKYNDKCYKFKEQTKTCDSNKKIVEIA